jgi:hypothetical protein
MTWWCVYRMIYRLVYQLLDDELVIAQARYHH